MNQISECFGQSPTTLNETEFFFTANIYNWCHDLKTFPSISESLPLYFSDQKLTLLRFIQGKQPFKLINAIYGCNHMIVTFQSTIFMEPFTTEGDTPIKNGMPALMYGTQLSEEGLKCSIPGRDYNKLYDIWSCPRLVMNVAVSTRMFTSRPGVPIAYHKCGILDKKCHSRTPSPPKTNKVSYLNRKSQDLAHRVLLPRACVCSEFNYRI